MRIKIFQINLDKDNNRLWLCSLDTVKRVAGRVPREIYDMVYEGDVPCFDLEAVYTMFNQADRPNKDGMRKLGVSDVVAICDTASQKEAYYYCDNVGFTEIEFLLRFQAGKQTSAKEETKNLKLPSWVAPIKKTYGKGPAALLYVGIERLLEALRTTISKLQDSDQDGRYDTLSKYPKNELLKYLPTRYRDRYDVDFLNQLQAYTLLLVDRCSRDELSYTNCIIEEIILRTATRMAQKYFNKNPDAIPAGPNINIRDKLWYIDIAGDPDIETLLYDDEDPIELTPEDDYYYMFDNWFKDCYQAPPEPPTTTRSNIPQE